MTKEPDWDALEKEMAECNEKKKAWDNAWDRVWEIWKICAKHEKEFWEWHNKKYPKAELKEINKGVYEVQIQSQENQKEK
ncbi:MAG: hypothetical protein WC365_09260 [Candidatus Babeliales bacterium]